MPTDPPPAPSLLPRDSDEAAAEGRFVHVYVDAGHDRSGGDARTVAPMPDVIRDAVSKLLR